MTTNERREALEQAAEIGRLRAERLDAELRAAEQREREIRLSRLAWEGSGAEPEAPAALLREGGGEGGSAAEVWRLRQDVERLAAFHQAVQRSRAWRLIQWVRRPLGRAW